MPRETQGGLDNSIYYQPPFLAALDTVEAKYRYTGYFPKQCLTAAALAIPRHADVPSQRWSYITDNIKDAWLQLYHERLSDIPNTVRKFADLLDENELWSTYIKSFLPGTHVPGPFDTLGRRGKRFKLLANPKEGKDVRLFTPITYQAWLDSEAAYSARRVQTKYQTGLPDIASQLPPQPNEAVNPRLEIGKNIFDQWPFKQALQYVHEFFELDLAVVRSIATETAVRIPDNGDLPGKRISDQNTLLCFDQVLKNLPWYIGYNAADIQEVSYCILKALDQYPYWCLYIKKFPGQIYGQNGYLVDGGWRPAYKTDISAVSYHPWAIKNAKRDKALLLYGLAESLPQGYPTEPPSPYAPIGKGSARRSWAQRSPDFVSDRVPKPYK